MAPLFWLIMQLYLLVVADDGDFRNDFLTHLPAEWHAMATHLAHLLFGA